MNFDKTDIEGVLIITPQRAEDARGFFARVWCAHEFAEHGLSNTIAQMSVSRNRSAGTLRGMHFQIAPNQEVKLVRVTKGSVYDVVVDLRPGSRTFLKSAGFHLSEANHRMVYVPKGFAHGFLTLEDDSELFYQMSEFHAPESARGIRYNDPKLGIEWPGEVRLISPRDAGYPDIKIEDFQQ